METTGNFFLAAEIANSLEGQIKIVDSGLDYKRILKLAIYTADCMKAITPMYIGNLNPKWKQYDTVIKILKYRLNAIEV